MGIEEGAHLRLEAVTRETGSGIQKIPYDGVLRQER